MLFLRLPALNSALTRYLLVDVFTRQNHVTKLDVTQSNKKNTRWSHYDAVFLSAGVTDISVILWPF